jgi:Carboxypeptidase regulatory-like domain
MHNRFLKLFFCFLAVCVALIYAQTTGGTLSGTVTSPTGAAVANAAVTITNTSTNAAQRVLTASDGTFTVSGLTPGSYKLEVESSGFKRSSQQSIDLTAGAPGPITITLEPGSMSETVEIKAHAPMIQTDNNEMSVGLNMRTVQELPVIDRNHQELVNLQPRITPPDVRFPLTQDPARQRGVEHSSGCATKSTVRSRRGMPGEHNS